MSSVRYYLPPHVFIACIEDFSVLLDLNNNRYLSVPISSVDQLGPWLHGWDRRHSDTPIVADSPTKRAASLASALVSKGLLCDSSTAGKAVRPISISRPASSLRHEHLLSPLRRPYRHIPGVMGACIKSAYLLRWQTIHRVIDRAAARKQPEPPNQYPLVQHYADPLSAFITFRPIYPRQYRCLFDCLSLLEFLFHHRLTPTWVFGVTMNPFQAHCWLQSGDLLINDSIERISAYTPILAI
jgi:hypothetical protein